MAARGVHKLPPINSSAQLKEALQKLASIPSSRIMVRPICTGLVPFTYKWVNLGNVASLTGQISRMCIKPPKWPCSVC